MRRKRLPKSIRKFVRLEKARLRRQVFDSKEREKLIAELYQKVSLKPKTKQLIKIKNLAGNIKAESKI